MERAGSDTALAATDAFKGTRRAFDDRKITVKVKTALHEDKQVGESDIHVRTTAGVVTLTGRVVSPEAASHVVGIARHVEGVNCPGRTERRIICEVHGRQLPPMRFFLSYGAHQVLVEPHSNAPIE